MRPRDANPCRGRAACAGPENAGVGDVKVDGSGHPLLALQNTDWEKLSPIKCEINRGLGFCFGVDSA
jgi:hypothetical protein